MPTQKGDYSRGYISYIDLIERAQFITWKLVDAVPMQSIEAWKRELANLPESARKLKPAAKVETYCDHGHGKCILNNPAAARIVQEHLIQSHGSMFELHGWVVMPNHVHVLLTPDSDLPLGELMKKGKGATAHKVNQLIGRSGKLWQEDFFDRHIRNSEHFEGVLKYMEWNPVKAKLCSDPKFWGWSSASENAQARMEMLHPA